jgi:hypothetical protein
VNGAWNYVGDGHVGEWIRTLDRARELGAVSIGPGHGPYGPGSVLDDQQLYFKELYRVVGAAAKGKSAADVQRGVEALRAELAANARIARYIGDGFAGQAAKVYNEITGQSFPDKAAEADAQRRHLASHHGDAGGGHAAGAAHRH